MIFIYPALVTKNVDKHIALACAKSLELYHLIHLAEAISMGQLQLTVHWDSGKKRYGSYVFEGLDNLSDKPILLESIAVIKADIKRIEKDLDDAVDHLEVIKKEIRKQQHIVRTSKTKSIINRAKAIIDTKNEEMHGVTATITKYSTQLTRLYIGLSKEEQEKTNDDRIVSQQKISDAKLKVEEARNKNEKKKGKIQRDIENLKRLEQELEKLDKLRDVGTYDAKTVEDIDFRPTMMKIAAIINFKGGPEQQKMDKITKQGIESITVNFSKQSELKKTEIIIGVKIVPVYVTGRKLEDLLTDDYYSGWWKTRFKQFARYISRNIVGRTLRIIGHILTLGIFLVYKKIQLPGQQILDPYYDILSTEKGYLNAASFKTSEKLPYMNYATAIAMISISDLDIDGDDLFSRPGFFRKMLLLGWNSIVFVDDSKQMCYFVSFLEGGSVSFLPYSYMFSALKMNDLYKDIDPLKRYASPFYKKQGNFKSLLKYIRQTNKVRESIDLKLKNYSSDDMEIISENIDTVEDHINRKLNKYSI